MYVKETRDFIEHHIIGAMGVEKLVYAIEFFLHILQRKLPDRLFRPEDYEFNDAGIDWDYIRFSMYFLVEKGIVLHRKNNYYTLETTKGDSKEMLENGADELSNLIDDVLKTSEGEFEIATIPPKKRGRVISEESLLIKGAIEDTLKITKDCLDIIRNMGVTTRGVVFSTSEIAKKYGRDVSAATVNSIMVMLVKEGKMIKVPGGYAPS